MVLHIQTQPVSMNLGVISIDHDQNVWIMAIEKNNAFFEYVTTHRSNVGAPMSARRNRHLLDLICESHQLKSHWDSRKKASASDLHLSVKQRIHFFHFFFFCKHSTLRITGSKRPNN